MLFLIYFSEVEGIALRYWHSGKGCIVEHVLDVKLAEDRTAKGLMSLAKTTWRMSMKYQWMDYSTSLE